MRGGWGRIGMPELAAGQLGRERRRQTGLALAVLLAALLPGSLANAEEPSSSASVVTETRVVGDERRTRFVADLSAPVEVSVFTLADPYRIVVDLPEVHFRLPPGTGESARGLISAYRYGLISRGKSRIVLDVSDPVAVDKTFVVPAGEGQPPRLVVDLVASTREAFLETSRTLPEPPAAAPPRPADTRLGALTVVIDPGHGGIDAGAVGGARTLEKDVTLAFSRLLAEKLRARGQYEVLLTRNDDSFVGLAARVAFAREHHADLFLSIHADSFRGEDVRGASVYTLSERASNAMAAAIAEGENRSDILAGVDLAASEDIVADILVDLARRETKNFSVLIARDLIAELGKATRLFKNPQQEAGFRVLMAPDVPSVLVELGYISNPEDEKVLGAPEWQASTADAVVRAVDAFFAPRMARRASR